MWFENWNNKLNVRTPQNNVNSSALSSGFKIGGKRSGISGQLCTTTFPVVQIYTNKIVLIHIFKDINGSLKYFALLAAAKKT